SATGYIIATAPSKFESMFIIDDLKYKFSCILPSSIPPFECKDAVLTFTHIKQLTSTRLFNGKIGSETVNLDIQNGPNIQGTLDKPLESGISVSGSGVW
ncbi:hypothetical protein CPB84DRAFT_1650004, partial [Gymnopilus junonius]